MENIDVFVYSKLKLMNEKPSRIISWITILSILSIILLFISLLFKYHIYSNYIGYVDINKKYNVKIIIDDKIFPIKYNYNIFIDNKRYSYEIVDINKQEGYYELFILCDLDKELLINNNIVTVRFEKETTTLMKELIKRLKKGMS